MTRVSLGRVLQIIREEGDTLILCHRNPDPDTLGSAFALKHIIEHYGSQVFVACSDNASQKLSFITQGESLEYVERDYKKIIAVDVASPSQLGDLQFLADRVDLIIDHHEMNNRFATYYEDFGAACAEIIYELYALAKIKMPKHFFECIYAGISGDTGGFRYSNVTRRTMEYGSYAMERGIDYAEINRIIFDTKTLGQVRAEKLTGEKMKLLCDGAFSVILFTNEMKNDNEICDEDITDIVNYIRSIEGVLVAVSIKQGTKDENKYSISSRANCDIDVSKICAMLGGGGHQRAAGASVIASSPEEAYEACVPLFEKAVKEYKLR